MKERVAIASEIEIRTTSGTESDSRRQSAHALVEILRGAGLDCCLIMEKCDSNLSQGERVGETRSRQKTANSTRH